MSNLVLGWPNWSDVGVLYTPTFDSGSWQAGLPLTNLQDRRLAKVARSTDAALSSTRFRADLKTDRQVRVAGVPKLNISAAGKVRFLGVPSTMLFDYEAGDDIAALGGTFTRATDGGYIDRGGVYRVAAPGVPRDGHFISGLRTILLELSSKNVVLQASNFGTTWAPVGTPTRTAAAHTAAGVTLDLIGDDDAGVLEGYTQTVTFVGNAAKGGSIHVKKDTSSSSVFRVRDTTAGADRLLGVITWSGSVPSVAMTTGTYLGFDVMADGVYRLHFTTGTVTAANVNSVQVYPATDSGLATGATGRIYAGGVQFEEQHAIPSSFIPTTTVAVTRNTDVLDFPYTAAPALLGHVYCKFVERGNTQGTGAIRAWGISTSAVTPAFYITFNAVYGTRMTIGGVTTSSTVAPVPVLNDAVEMIATLDITDGSNQLAISVNGGAVTTGADSGANANWLSGGVPITAWGQQTVHLGENDRIAIAALRIGPQGSVDTIAEAQSEVYDSGWLTPWPAGETAETLDGINLGAVAVVPVTAAAARYWSVQIDDALNAAGYLEAARLFVGGGYQPSYNASYGLKLGWGTDSTAERSDGGALIHNERPRWRTADFLLDQVPNPEALTGPFDLLRVMGTHEQVYFVFDPADDAGGLLRRAFLATLRELSALDFAYFDRHQVPLGVAEEL